MNVGKTLALLATLGTIWGVIYMHDQAHRYDIVAEGAGSGGTNGDQQTAADVGTTEVDAYLLDRKTGKVWFVRGPVELPTLQRSCQDMGGTESESGCRVKK